MTVLSWHLMGAYGLSAAFTVDADYKAFAVSALMVLEGRDRNAVRATLGEGLSVSAFPLYVPV
jgi:hypothetical protein